MRVELHPVFNVHINLEDLRNVDLSTRGYYQVRLTPRPSPLFTSIDIQCVDTTRSNEDSFILPSSINDGVGISRSVELTYIDETLPLGDPFLISLRLDAHADLELPCSLVLDVELWSMDRHRPPNFSLFELDSKRTVEVTLRAAQLVASSREIFFEHNAYAVLKMTVFASLVSVLPRRKKRLPDPDVDTKSKQFHLTTGSILLQSISSIEQFVFRNIKEMVTSVNIEPCDVNIEMESLKCRLETATNPWVELEDVTVSLSSRLSLLYAQLIRLCTGSPAISSVLLQNYLKFREKMLAELFFFVEYAPSELSKYSSTDKIYSLVSKSKYLEKLPRFSLFCPELDTCASNWCLVVEERFSFELKSPDVSIRSTSSDHQNLDQKPSPSTIGPMGDGLPILRHDPLRINSRFPWFRRKSVNGTTTSNSSQQTDSCRSPQLCLEQQPLSVFPPEQDLSMVVDFVVERERMKLDLQEQRLFDGFIYSEQAILRHGGDVRKPVEQPTHLVVFVHGLEGTCDDLSSYRNVFRIIAGDTPGFHYLLSSSNHTKTWSDIDEMAENLLSEVQSYVLRYSEPPVRVSFVAHSLGGVIVRAAVCRDEAEWLRPRLHCLMTINSPHLGLAYVGKGVNLGIQFMQWWKQSRCMEQLSLKDETTFCDSLLFRLSQKKTFGLFRRVLLIGTPADLFVPCHSALLTPCKSALKDPSALGSTYRDMLSNVHDDITTSDRTTVAIRYSTWHSISSPRASRFTGRAAHIAAVEDDIFIEKLFATSAFRYFME
ncbi:hypothetical protein RB195_004195 [Necator americanus]|uniref:DUF676 domain-containing protein n=1 Tax=Necator americanus TaxID=51031 RepID=A0ABR1BLD4_NECAM